MKDRDKIGFFVMFIKSTWGGITEKKLYIFIMVPKFSTLIYKKVKFIKSDYGYHSSFLLIFTTWQLRSYCSSCSSSNTIVIVNFHFSPCSNSNPGIYYQLQISPCGNSDPGHGTKFVTLPSSILLYKYYFKADSMCLQLSYC